MSNDYLKNFQFESFWSVVDVLTPIILSNVKGSIIEIGMGNSTTMLLRHANKYDRILMSCDTSDKVISKVEKNIKKYGLNNDKHFIYQIKSWFFIDQLKEMKIEDKNPLDYLPAIVFIDGNHYYETVKVEIDYFLSILQQNAMIFMHDTYPQKHYYDSKIRLGRKCDTYKVRLYLESRKDLFTFTWPYTASYCGLTMVMKKDPERIVGEETVWTKD